MSTVVCREFWRETGTSDFSWLVRPPAARGSHSSTRTILQAAEEEQTHPLLDELEGPLVFRHLQQLHRSPLIRSKATDLADHVPHKLAVLGKTLQTNEKGDTRMSE